MYTVYIAGEIHSNWGEEIITGCKDCDVTYLTPEYDHVSAKINSMRNHTYIKQADIVVVKFGEKYKQWNAAFNVGYANALDKKLIVIHPEEFIHALKEIDAAASAVVKSESQVIDILNI